LGKGAQYAAFADKADNDLNGAKTDTLEPSSRISAARSMQADGADAEVVPANRRRWSSTGPIWIEHHAHALSETERLLDAA
jgi:hypothetical protein